MNNAIFGKAHMQGGIVNVIVKYSERDGEAGRKAFKVSVGSTQGTHEKDSEVAVRRRVVCYIS
jgi:hypothetical protein